MSDTRRQWAEKFQVQSELRGMVPDLDGDGLFREAQPQEKPMNHKQRNQLAQLLIDGATDAQVREVIGSW
jgi:hypothetical protein